MRKKYIATIILILICYGCNRHPYDYVVMSGEGMAPAIVKGSKVRVDKAAYVNSTPARWDIVLFRHPKTGELGIKRIIGLPGENIYTHQDHIIVAGKRINNPSSLLWPIDNSLTTPDKFNPFIRTIQLDGVSVFVLGDNLPNSYDSRHMGPIQLTDIIGKIQ